MHTYPHVYTQKKEGKGRDGGKEQEQEQEEVKYFQ